MKYTILSLFSIFILMSCNQKKHLIIESKTQIFQAEVAVTPAERQIGLMNRTELPKNHGMLFKLPVDGKHGFWMKNTLIPLDIVWLSKDKVIVDIQTAQPCVNEICEIYTSKTESRYVLEVNANEFKGRIGEELSWKDSF